MSYGQAADADTLQSFPEAGEGQMRHVIELPALPDEYTVKVELLVGKTIETDCNRHFFGGEMTEKTVEGFGYNYYEVAELKGPMSTLMACADADKKQEFVTLQGQDLVRYNSRLPIVVYTPEGTEVKYRIWQANVLVHDAEQK